MRREGKTRTVAASMMAVLGVVAISASDLPATSLPVRPVSAPALLDGSFTQALSQDVLVHLQTTTDGGTSLSAEAPGVRVDKVVHANAMLVTLVSDTDRVSIRADGSGTITVTRFGRSNSMAPSAFTKKDLLQVRSLLAGSDAVAAFRLLAGHLENDDQGSAGESLALTGAMVGLLDGDLTAPGRLAQRILRKRAVRLRQVVLQKGPGECWDLYAREAGRIAQDAIDCQQDHRWNPVALAGCGAEFVIRAELNWFWVIACSGGLPD